MTFLYGGVTVGFDASTSGNGKNTLEPLLVRVQTQAAMKGCFVIAEAGGRAEEFADARGVTALPQQWGQGYY